jgi:hypothetical protein
VNTTPRSLESRRQLILRWRRAPIPIRAQQSVAQDLCGMFPGKAKAKRGVIQQLAPPHYPEVFGPLHGEPDVSEACGFEIVLRVLYLSGTHGFRKPLEALGGEFGQQTGDVFKVVSRSAMGDTCLLGEVLIYAGFALASWHWEPALVLAGWSVFFVHNMRRKDESMSRYPEFAAYKERSGMLLPSLRVREAALTNARDA